MTLLVQKYLHVSGDREVDKTLKQTNTLTHLPTLTQGIDGSARKPALRQDTGYMVEKTYHDIAPYLRAFGAYVMPQ